MPVLGLVITWCSAAGAAQYPGARTRYYLVLCCWCCRVCRCSGSSLLGVLLLVLPSIPALGLVTTWCYAAGAVEYAGARARHYLVFCCWFCPVSRRSDSLLLGVMLLVLSSMPVLGLVITWCSAAGSAQYPGART